MSESKNDNEPVHSVTDSEYFTHVLNRMKEIGQNAADTKSMTVRFGLKGTHQPLDAHAHRGNSSVRCSAQLPSGHRLPD